MLSIMINCTECTKTYVCFTSLLTLCFRVHCDNSIRILLLSQIEQYSSVLRANRAAKWKHCSVLIWDYENLKKKSLKGEYVCAASDYWTVNAIFFSKWNVSLRYQDLGCKPWEDKSQLNKSSKYHSQCTLICYWHHENEFIIF